MDAGSELQPLVGHVRDGDLSDGCHQIQSHLGDLVSMSIPVSLWQTAHNHVGIPNCLHLVGQYGNNLLKRNTILPSESFREDTWGNQVLTFMIA